MSNSKEGRKAKKSVYDIVPIPLYIPKPTPTTKPRQPVKIATPDLLLPLKESTIPVETMESLIFEQIGGQEILDVTRTDLMGDIDIEYQPVSNLKDIYLNNEQTSLTGFVDEGTSYFNSFPVDINDYLVYENTISNVSYVVTKDNVIPIINAVGDGTYVTYETPYAHGISEEDVVSVRGSYPDSFNLENATVFGIVDNTKFILSNNTTLTFQSSNISYVDPVTGEIVIEVNDVPYGYKLELEVLYPKDSYNSLLPEDGNAFPIDAITSVNNIQIFGSHSIVVNNYVTFYNVENPTFDFLNGQFFRVKSVSGNIISIDSTNSGTAIDTDAPGSIVGYVSKTTKPL
jgi:hypothetical protein